MASPEAFKFTFLRGSGFLHSLVGAWDLMADGTGQWQSQTGFLIFEETTIIAVVERDKDIRRGIEGIYSVEDHRILITELLVDTAPERGAPGDMEFEMDGDILTMTWRMTNQAGQLSTHIDQFRRRSQPDNRGSLTQGAVYQSGR